ncbi:hypothetical protein MLD52_05900 [Puniceicoccaceae bacterium K14]|nr:hypothetical protein [Puniceicoccaceae bacterium K14]
MELQRFFDHWTLKEHPFQAEEARDDGVYNRMLEDAITHPDFSKIYGDPSNPNTTVVFGEKGSGKTAMRLMIQRKVEEFNRNRTSGMTYLVCYDDLNPTLDKLARSVKTEDVIKTLEAVRLSDHQDAILSLAVTKFLENVLSPTTKAEGKKLKKTLRKMSFQKRMDLATLALLYDQPSGAQSSSRWKSIIRMLKVGTSWNRVTHGAMTVTLGILGIIGGIGWKFIDSESWEAMGAAGAGGAGFLFVGGWWLIRSWKRGSLARRLVKEIRVVSNSVKSLKNRLWDLKEESLKAEPLPKKGDQDNRYALTSRFTDIIHEAGYSSMIVLVDRMDEPMIVNGEADKMKLILWPMMNNKFLQQNNIGIKMLLPIEISQMLSGESSDFRRQARLDKQNVVNPLKWTGITLYDLCNWRFNNCQSGEKVRLEDLFDDETSQSDLIDALEQMHQPRDAFKFLYAIIAEHCNNTSSDEESFKISRSTLDFVRRSQKERLVELYRGTGTA